MGEAALPAQQAPLGMPRAVLRASAGRVLRVSAPALCTRLSVGSLSVGGQVTCDQRCTSYCPAHLPAGRVPACPQESQLLLRPFGVSPGFESLSSECCAPSSCSQENPENSSRESAVASSFLLGLSHI